MNELTIRANAKINLFLEVLNKRDDGYHNIETVFQSIDLYDTIVLRESHSDAIQIESDHPRVPLDSSNLAHRAARLLAAESGRAPGIVIHITKRIPVGAGLAGGSADAAATLMGLNELWDLGLDTEALSQIGKRLGADVPFCISGGTAMGRARGDRLTKLDDFSGVPLVLANPGFEISAGWA